jgi:hypothetical protein
MQVKSLMQTLLLLQKQANGIADTIGCAMEGIWDSADWLEGPSQRRASSGNVRRQQRIVLPQRCCGVEVSGL